MSETTDDLSFCELLEGVCDDTFYEYNLPYCENGQAELEVSAAPDVSIFGPLRRAGVSVHRVKHDCHRNVYVCHLVDSRPY